MARAAASRVTGPERRVLRPAEPGVFAAGRSTRRSGPVTRLAAAPVSYTHLTLPTILRV